jgi:hypothetical protein
MNSSGARGPGVWPRAFVAAAALWSASCAAPLMKLPDGPGVPAVDAADALAQATATCRGIKTLTAEIAITGSAGGRRVRGRLLAGVAAPASVRLEATAPFGAPVFIFAAAQDDATLLLPRDNRVLEHGRPATVLNAVAGVPLDGADLNAILSGCAPDGSQTRARALGPDWRLLNVSAGPVSYDVYLHRERAAAPWRLTALTRHGSADGVIRVEYRDFQNDLPRSIRLADTRSPKESAFDLTLGLSQVETNVPLGADVFRVEIPPSADPITEDELRRARLGIREN